MARSRLSRLSLLTCQSTPIRALHSTRIQTANPIDGTPVRPPTLHHADLSTTISAIFNTPYLSRAPMQVIRPLRIEGILHGPMLNPIVSMVASHGLNAIHVHFLVDPSSPTTFLSRQATTSLLGQYLASSWSEFPKVKLSGYPVPHAQQSRDWFAGLNVLGGDFLREHGVRVDVRYKAGSVEMSFVSSGSGSGSRLTGTETQTGSEIARRV